MWEGDLQKFKTHYPKLEREREKKRTIFDVRR